MNTSKPDKDLNTLANLISGRISPREISESYRAEIVSLAEDQGLGPMLLTVLLRDPQISEADRWLQPLIKSAKHRALHYALLDKTRRELGEALRKSGIPAAWLKGIALAHTVYPEPRLRPMVDLDVLVPVNKRVEAGEIARKIGFKPPGGDYLAQVGAPESVRYHDVYLGGPGDKITLEIHYRLLGLETERLLPLEKLAWFWEQTWAPEGLNFVILKPEAHLLYLCAHALLQHGEAYLDLLQLLDIHLLVTKNQMDWRIVVERAHSLGWAYAVERSLELSVEYFQTPVPEFVFEHLRSQPSSDPSRPTARRRQKKVTRWEEWKSIFRRQSTVRRARLVWTTLFPPENLLRELYHIKPGQSTLPYYLYHLWDGGREVLRSLTSR